MELVYDDARPMERPLHCVPVGLPHIHGDDFHSPTAMEVVEVLADRGLAPVLQEGNDRAFFQIGQDAARMAEQCQFIDAQPLRRSKDGCLIEVPHMFMKDGTYRPLIQTAFLGNADEGAPERHFPDMLKQSFRHLVLLVHMGQGLEHGAATIGTAIPLALNVNPDAFAMHGQIEEQLLPPAEALQHTKAQARRAGKNVSIVACHDVVLAWTFLGLQDRPLRQVQDIHMT